MNNPFEKLIAEQLYPIMNDFFIGLYEIKDNIIKIKFHTGQVFNITVTECKYPPPDAKFASGGFILLYYCLTDLSKSTDCGECCFINSKYGSPEKSRSLSYRPPSASIAYLSS